MLFRSYLVNASLTNSSFTLNFFDKSGGTLKVPVLLPQFGLTFAADNFTRHLAAGAMLVVETNASDFVANIAGSAQVLSTGNVTGYEVFRWSKPKQETAVSFETRTPGSFVLPFDNTGTLST